MIQVAVHSPTVTSNSFVSFSSIKPRSRTRKIKSGVFCAAFDQTVGGQLLIDNEKSKRKRRVFFLDVNPLCYEGRIPSLHSFGHWISLFFRDVSHTDPVIAVISFISFFMDSFWEFISAVVKLKCQCSFVNWLVKLLGPVRQRSRVQILSCTRGLLCLKISVWSLLKILNL